MVIKTLNVAADDIIINVKQDIFVFPTGLYNIPNNSILYTIDKMFPRPIANLNRLVKDRKIDIGHSFSTYLFDNKDICLLITCFNVNDELKENNRSIDYEMLYLSLLDLYKDISLRGNIKKIGFCINDFINIGCDIDILKTFIKSIFKDYKYTITFIHGK